MTLDVGRSAIGCWTLEVGRWTLDVRPLDDGPWKLDVGRGTWDWTMDARMFIVRRFDARMLDVGRWTLLDFVGRWDIGTLGRWDAGRWMLAVPLAVSDP